MPIRLYYYHETPSAASVEQEIHIFNMKIFGKCKQFDKTIWINHTIHISIAECCVHTKMHVIKIN